MLNAFPSILTHINRLKSHFIGTFIYDSFSQTVTKHNETNLGSLPLRHFSQYFLIIVTFHKPNLNSRVHVIVDIIVFQHAMAIVIEVDPNLFK